MFELSVPGSARRRAARSRGGRATGAMRVAPGLLGLAAAKADYSGRAGGRGGGGYVTRPNPTGVGSKYCIVENYLFKRETDPIGIGSGKSSEDYNVMFFSALRAM